MSTRIGPDRAVGPSGPAIDCGDMRPVDLLGLHLESSSGAPVVLLREHDEPHRVIPIFIGAAEAAAIALAVSGEDAPRPLTHDLLAVVFDALGGTLESVEVTELREGTFHALLRVDGVEGPMALDSRPSDGIALALRLDAPILVAEAVLEEAGTVVAEPGDTKAIEGAVSEFRRFLDEVEPEDFAPGSDPGGE